MHSVLEPRVECQFSVLVTLFKQNRHATRILALDAFVFVLETHTFLASGRETILQ